ncbi:glycosyltransferase family 2 protein [Halobacterium noricense]|nr:glycosyltransferase family 2 protein [Halobacterium noricense]
MLESLPEDGELIIVDGGSTDGSIEKLQSFDDDRIEVIVEKSNLGEGRQIAMNRCSGDAVVEHLDTDRVYGDLTQYLDLYETLREEHPNLFLMTLDSVYLTSPEVSHQIGGWPPISRAEERVYTDRAITTEEITPRLYPESKSQEINTEDVSSIIDRLEKWKYEVRDNIRCGFSLRQIIRFHYHEFSLPKALVADTVGVLGWIEAQGMEEYGRDRLSWREFPSWEYRLASDDEIVLDGPENFGWDK